MGTPGILTRAVRSLDRVRVVKTLEKTLNPGPSPGRIPYSGTPALGLRIR